MKKLLEKIIFLYLILVVLNIYVLYAKETLYLNIPKPYPSKQINTSFGKELLTLINEAQKEIDFAIYGLRGQDTILRALIEAKKRGVVIKGVVNSDSHNKNYYSDTKLLYNFFTVVSDHRSYIMHNKFFIIDNKILWSGSSNISDTGTGGYNANNVVVIEDTRVAKIYKDEFEQMYHDKLFHIHKYSHSLKNIQTKNSQISIYFSPKSDTYTNAIKPLILHAKKYIYIPIFYLTRKDLAQDLLLAKERGVDIKIILDATAARNRYSIHKYLRSKGIAIKVENFGGKMHTKSIIIDDKCVVSGSMNFTKAGNSKNDENTLVIKNKKLAMQYKNYFLKLWQLIPNKYLYTDPNPESLESGNSCYDGIDNDFDKHVDGKDSMCYRIHSILLKYILSVDILVFQL